VQVELCPWAPPPPPPLMGPPWPAASPPSPVAAVAWALQVRLLVCGTTFCPDQEAQGKVALLAHGSGLTCWLLL
jgi:hypothetical protein